MNTLTYQQLANIQQQLGQIQLPTSLILQFPKQHEISYLLSFTGQLYNSHSQKLKTFMNNKLSSGNCVKAKTVTEPNSVIKMFIDILFALIYAPSKNHSPNHSQSIYNKDLLNTIKCSIYCKEISLSQITNSEIKVKGILGQAMLHQLFTFLIDFQVKHNDNSVILKCIEWMLQKNHKVYDLLTLLLRFILNKLKVKGASDFNSHLNTQETIINLVQYFDLSYRRIDNLFLFNQDGYFFVNLESEIAFGEYTLFEYQKDQIKKYQSCQLDRSQIEYALNERKSKINETQNEAKKHNFILRSSCESDYKEQYSVQTPTFQQSGDFCFGKRKRESIDEKDLQREFARIISDSDPLSDSQENSFSLPKSPEISNTGTPTWQLQNFIFSKKQDTEGKEMLQLSNKISFKRQIDPKKVECISEVQQFKSQIDNKNFLKNEVQKSKITPKSKLSQTFPSKQKTISKIFQQKALYFNSSQQIGKNYQFDIQIQQKFDIKNCACVKTKKLYISIASKVVNFTFKPHVEEKQNKRQFLTNTNESNDKDRNIKITVTPPKTKNISKLTYSNVSHLKVPSFLKQRQQKQRHSNSPNEGKQLKYPMTSASTVFKPKKRQITTPNNDYSRYSYKFYDKNNQQYFNQTEQIEKSRRMSNLPIQNVKKHDINQTHKKNHRLQDSAAQNQHPKSVQNFSFNNNKFSYTCSQIQPNSPFSVYAPVQIIAPTINFQPNNKSEGQIVCNCHYEQNKDLSKSKKVNQNFVSNHFYDNHYPGIKSNNNQRILKTFKNQEN